MPVERVPGFWDYMAQGFGWGADKALEYGREQRARADAQKAQENNLMLALFNQGSVDSGTLEGVLRKNGVNLPLGQLGAPGAPVTPGETVKIGDVTLPAPGVVTPPQRKPVIQANVAERRRKAFGAPGALEKMSDEEKRELGFQTSAEKRIQQGQLAEVDWNTKKIENLTRFANGEQLPPNQYQIYGIQDPKDRELQRLVQMDPYLGSVGERFVAGEMVKNGGRIKAGTAPQLAEQAYQQYVAQRTAHGLGALSPEQVEYTRSYFSRAVNNAMIAQGQRDLEEYEARTRRTAADAQASNAGENVALKWFGQLNRATEALRQKQNDLMKASPALVSALDPNSTLRESPFIKGALAEWEQAEQAIEALRQSQGMLTNGQVPGNLQELLTSADRVIASIGKGGAPAVAAPPAGGAQQQGTPKAEGRSLIGGAQRNTPKVDLTGVHPGVRQVYETIASGKATVAQLDKDVAAGKIPKAAADQVKRLLQQAGK